MKTDQTEKQFQDQVLRLAGQLGYLAFHCFDSRKSAEGFPDLCLVGTHPDRRRTVFAELKTETGRVSYAQRRWLEALRATGAEVYVWRPADLQQIATILAAPVKCTPAKEASRVRT